MVWLFLQLFFSKKFIVEVAQLNDLSAMQRMRIAIDTHCTLAMERIFENIASEIFQAL